MCLMGVSKMTNNTQLNLGKLTKTGTFLQTKEGTMLVLSRRIGETIVINGDIQVKVLSVQGNKVRLGVVAPEHVAVDRQEVHERRVAFADAEPNLPGATVLSN